jgi:hypothetical protein
MKFLESQGQAHKKENMTTPPANRGFAFYFAMNH